MFVEKIEVTVSELTDHHWSPRINRIILQRTATTPVVAIGRARQRNLIYTYLALAGSDYLQTCNFCHWKFVKCSINTILDQITVGCAERDLVGEGDRNGIYILSRLT